MAQLCAQQAKDPHAEREKGGNKIKNKRKYKYAPINRKCGCAWAGIAGRALRSWEYRYARSPAFGVCVTVLEEKGR